MELAYKFFKKFPAGHVLHRLPVHYRRHLIKMFEQPTPVHYIPEPKEWIKDPETGEKKRVVNVPLPLKFPKEADEGLWGGEGVVKGFQVRKRFGSRIPHWWTPILKRAIVYSEILDKYMTVIVTERTMCLVDEAHGFDNYILKTHDADLRSLLGLRLRRQMILALIHKSSYPNNPEKQAEIYEKFKEFIVPEEEAEWIGLTLSEAFAKQKAIEAAQLNSQYPLKDKYRRELFHKLKEMQSNKAGEEELERLKGSWLKRLNPFSRSSTTTEENSTTRT